MNASVPNIHPAEERAAPPLTVVRTGSVAQVVLTNPRRHNAVTAELIIALIDTARQLTRDRTLRAVILRGEGPSFCSGLDIPALMKRPGTLLRLFLPSLARGTHAYQEMAWAWRRLPVPVIAVLHGRCYGAGLQLALAADFRFATPSCELALMESKWGLVPDMSATVSLRELIPLDVAKRLAMTGETLTAARAQSLGLVTEVHEDPQAAAEALVAQLLTRSPDAVTACKGLFQRAWFTSVRHAFALERRYQLRLLMGANQRRAVQQVQSSTPVSYQPRQRGWRM